MQNFKLFASLLFSIQCILANPEVIADFNTRIKADPNNSKIHYEYGCYLAGLDHPKLYDQAHTALKKALNLEPNQLNWKFYYGTFCCKIGRFADSLDAYKEILQQRPSLLPVLYNSGFTLKTAGELDQAIALYRKAILLNPDYNQARLALALALLTKGDFKSGWQEHTWNLKHQGKNAPEFQKLVSENSLAGKRIFLTPEGGLGDTIQFIRYAQLISQMGAYVIVAAQKPLLPLLAGCTYIDKLIPIDSPRPAYDAKVTLMSLPAILKNDEASIPINIPYIFPPQERIEFWQQKLSDINKVKIGICWQPDVHNDVSRLAIARRGIPLELFEQLGKTPNVWLCSLQKIEGLDQIAKFKNKVEIETFDTNFDNMYGSFVDSSSVMHSLDLVISTDTAIAHLAGAMGKKVWLLLPYATDWRWIAQRNDSPWYPTMRIFKQPSPFDWESVMSELLQTFNTEFSNSF